MEDEGADKPFPDEFFPDFVRSVRGSIAAGRSFLIVGRVRTSRFMAGPECDRVISNLWVEAKPRMPAEFIARDRGFGAARERDFRKTGF